MSVNVYNIYPKSNEIPKTAKNRCQNYLEYWVETDLIGILPNINWQWRMAFAGQLILRWYLDQIEITDLAAEKQDVCHVRFVVVNKMWVWWRRTKYLHLGEGFWSFDCRTNSKHIDSMRWLRACVMWRFCELTINVYAAQHWVRAHYVRLYFCTYVKLCVCFFFKYFV